MIKKDSSKNKALKTSIKEGSSSSVSSSLGDGYISAFTTEMAQKTNPSNAGLFIGALSAISSLASPIAQFYGSKLMEKHPRKKIVLAFVLLQALVWIPLAALSITFYLGYIRTQTLYIVIALYALIAVFGGFPYPSWFSWMGDIVPENKRGEYFARRNLITGLVGLVAVILGALVIKEFEKQSIVLIGFGIFFFLAFIFRFISYSIFKKQYSPDFKFKESYKISFSQFLKTKDNYKKFRE